MHIDEVSASTTLVSRYKRENISRDRDYLLQLYHLPYSEKIRPFRENMEMA